MSTIESGNGKDNNNDKCDVPTASLHNIYHISHIIHSSASFLISICRAFDATTICTYVVLFTLNSYKQKHNHKCHLMHLYSHTLEHGQCKHNSYTRYHCTYTYTRKHMNVNTQYTMMSLWCVGELIPVNVSIPFPYAHKWNML